MRTTRRTRAVAVTGVAAVLATAAACGGSSSGGSAQPQSSSSASAGASTGGPITADALAQVQATVQKLAKRPTSIGITDPVKSVPKGKTLFYVVGESPAAATTAAAMKEAVTAIGWTYKQAQVPETPQGFQQGYNQALRDPNVAAIASTSIPKAVIATQVAAAAKRHIPVVDVTGPDESSGNFYDIGGPKSLTSAGHLKADYVLATTKGNVQMLLATSAALPSLTTMANGFKEEWAKQCPACKAPLVYDAPVSSFGSNFPSLLTAYLEAHRSVNYIDFGFNDMMLGVPQALKAAGFTSMKAITFNQGPETNSLLGDVLQAQVGFALIENSWLAVDTVLRALNGQSTDPDTNFNGPDNPFSWYITKDSLAAAGLDPTKVWPLNATYQDEFKKLWGVS